MRTFRAIGHRAGVFRGRADLPPRCTTDERTAAYRRWVQRHLPDQVQLARMADDAEALRYRPVISVITPVYNTDPKWLRACVDSVRRQAYSNWQLALCDDGSTSPETRSLLDELVDPRIVITRLERNSGISAASNAALASASGEFVALLDHDDELTPDALYEVARYLNASPDTDVLYSDEDKRDEDGELSDPFFKPDWSPEHLLSAMYTCHLTVARRTLVDRAAGFRAGYEGAQDYDLMLRLSEHTRAIAHLPKILYHWRRVPGSTAVAGHAKPWADDAGRRALEDQIRRNGVDATVVSGGVPGLYRVKFAIRGAPLVTIVIVTDAGAPLAADACAAAVRARTAYPRYDVVPAVGTPSTMTRQIGAIVNTSAGDHVVFVDAALRPLDDGWLTALVEYSQQDQIGAVGARIEYADGRLRHIGMVTCTDGGPAPVFHGHPGATYGHFSSAIGVRNYSAVSGECLMTRRAVFDRVGGFDDRLPWSGADVDYCLRAGRAGLRVVFTPYARLRRTNTGGAAGPDRHAAATLRSIWGSMLDGDPHYNRNLSRASADYLLDE